jgi:hypothetical protein
MAPTLAVHDVKEADKPEPRVIEAVDRARPVLVMAPVDVAAAVVSTKLFRLDAPLKVTEPEEVIERVLAPDRLPAFSAPPGTRVSGNAATVLPNVIAPVLIDEEQTSE